MDKATKIMVVDDSSRARNGLAAYLSLQAGIRITAEASNGQEAISKIKSCLPDLILMDIKMPIMNGLEATRIIKKNWPQIKVLALTMYSNYEPEAVSAGADAILVKSCSSNEIISTIH